MQGTKNTKNNKTNIKKINYHTEIRSMNTLFIIIKYNNNYFLYV